MTTTFVLEREKKGKQQKTCRNNPYNQTLSAIPLLKFLQNIFLYI